MAYLNANIPVTYAQIRREYLYDLKNHHGEVEDCIIFGMASITGRPILFHAIMENGAIFYRLPISCVYTKRLSSRKKFLNVDLMSYSSGIVLVIILLSHSWDILDGQAGKYIGKDKKWHSGKYLFTVDFAHPEK